jgi:hypothetical protein
MRKPNSMTKTKGAVPPAAPVRPPMTVEQLEHEVRAAYQRWRLLAWVADELDSVYGKGDGLDAPMLLTGAYGGQERPLPRVVGDLRGELLRASFEANAKYRRLMDAKVKIDQSEDRDDERIAHG